ncbi:MAG: hypothetical protein QME96_17295, partial [Myxococcota bacterium]|nr:hypothetical protein [Myxococcota bacterium]
EFECRPDFSVASGTLFYVGARMSWQETPTSTPLNANTPALPVVVDRDPPDGRPETVFDTFPAGHATFIEGDPVFVRVDLEDDTSLATYRCDPDPTPRACDGRTGPAAAGFGPSYFPQAYRIPEGRRQQLAFEWPTPAIPAGARCVDFRLRCEADDVAGRAVEFDRAGRVVRRPPDFMVRPATLLPDGTRYDDPTRMLRMVDLRSTFRIETDLAPAQLADLVAAGLRVEAELAVAAPPGSVVVSRPLGEFWFEREGVYYLQCVIGRRLADGSFDPVKMSANVVVALVTGIEARILAPLPGTRGVVALGARFVHDLQVQIIRPATGADYHRAGVPIEFRTTSDVLSFDGMRRVSVTRPPLLTDAFGRAQAPLFSTGQPGSEVIEVYEVRPGATPARRFLSAVTVDARRVEITFPTGHPVRTDSTDAGSADNEFTFTSDVPGVLRIRTTAAWEDGTPIPACASDPMGVPCRLRWDIVPPLGPRGGPPTVIWNVASPTVSSSGVGGENAVRFTGLPPRYDDFGPKQIWLLYDDS